MYVGLSIAVAATIVIALFFSDNSEKHRKSTKPVHDYSFTTIDGREIYLNSFRGKKILIVNVASKCGFTSQYEDLEKLYNQYKEKLVIIGFPSNDFFGQEPGTDEEIAAFCNINYGITFPLSQKISVTGKEKHQIYQWLTDKSLNGWNTAGPKWNFHKYLLDEEGELIEVFASTTKPLSPDIVSRIDAKK